MKAASISDRLFYLLQWLLPTLLLSGGAHRLAQSRRIWLKSTLIRVVSRKFGITLDDAEVRDFEAFPSFNAFFTRALAAGARPLAAAPALLCPVDGRISQLGSMSGQQIPQAKGRSYTIEALLGGHADLATPFAGGDFATVYLAPNNYHRIHMPMDAMVRSLVYVPGRLFSVNPATVRAADRLFARNERLAVVFESALGPFVIVLVGALLVGGIETVVSGVVTPPYGRAAFRRDYDDGLKLERGDELGRFNYGSTIIMLSPPGALRWNPALRAESAVRMGQQFGLPEAIGREVYGDSRSGNCYKLQLLLGHLQQPCEWQEIDVMSAATRSAEFLAMNPNGKIPLLQLDDGRCLPESNAALFHLAAGSEYWPQDEFAQAQVLQWLFFEQYSHEPYIATLRFWKLFLNGDPEQAASFEWRIPRGYAALQVMETHLQQNDFFVAGHYSIADIGLFAYTHVAADGGYDLERFPAIVGWLNRVQSQDGFVPMARP